MMIETTQHHMVKKMGRSIKKHIELAVEGARLGRSFSVTELRNVLTTEYPDPLDRPSAGAIKARLWSETYEPPEGFEVIDYPALMLWRKP
jgi:hypothetical protein